MSYNNPGPTKRERLEQVARQAVASRTAANILVVTFVPALATFVIWKSAGWQSAAIFVTTLAALIFIHRALAAFILKRMDP